MINTQFHIYLNWHILVQNLNHLIKQVIYQYQVELSIYIQLDIPFVDGEFNTKGAFVNMNVDDIECDEGIFVNE